MVILLLLCSFKSYCQTKGWDVSSTGEIQLTNDNKCIVPIELIKKANAKLVERKYFAKIICQQDTIINLQKQEIKEYSIIVSNMQNRILDANKYNEELQAIIEKQRVKNKIFIGTTCGAIAVTALLLLLN